MRVAPTPELPDVGSVPDRSRASLQPDLSVIVPAVNEWGDLSDCLRALERQEGDLSIEVIVVNRLGQEIHDRLRRDFPRVLVLETPARTTIPAMRGIGFQAAGADVIGVIEDHVLVPPEWARRMLEEHRMGARVVGGAVDNAACDRLVDWAAFLCEYSHCIEPPPAGPADWLTGNNVTYSRGLLEQFRDVIAEERWENRLHDAVRDSGVALESRPDIRVGHKKHFTVLEYCQQRYLYSRSYAGARASSASFGKRLLYGFGAVALPPILLYRVTRRIYATGRHRALLLRSLPLISLFTLSWAWGEAVGAWFGAGDSLGRVC